jgi:two-component system, OmpR family, response regulator
MCLHPWFTPPGVTVAAVIDSRIHVMLVEDDVQLAILTSRYLTASGCEVTSVATAPLAVHTAGAKTFDVVLLDLMLPGGDGIDVCRAIRKRLDVPIIMLTARREEADRIIGLDSGADDYVTKPFSSRELLSRIRAVVRRARGLVGPGTVLRAGPIELDLEARRATVRGNHVELTSYEFDLLRVLAERTGHVLTRDQLLDLARGSAELAFERSIDVQMSKLRQKLGDDAKHPRYLKTIRGVGYMLANEDQR